MKRFFPLLAAVLLLAAWSGTSGCSRRSDDRRHPLYRQAQHAKNNGDPAAAAAALRKALDLRPNSVLFHLELAEICDESLNDPLTAAYHYQEALNLAPDAPDAPQIEAWCHAAQLRFIAAHKELLQEAARPEIARLETEIARLETEDARLREYLRTLKAALAAASARRNAPAATPPPPAPAVPADPSASAMRTYTVQKGDTPGGIARKFYHDASRFRPILEANRDQIKDERSLQIGMVLKIPPDPNPERRKP